MSRQYDHNDQAAYNVPVRASQQPYARAIEGNVRVGVTVSGPGSRRGPLVDNDDRVRPWTMDMKPIYSNRSPRERSAAQALVALQDAED